MRQMLHRQRRVHNCSTRSPRLVPRPGAILSKGAEGRKPKRRGETVGTSFVQNGPNDAAMLCRKKLELEELERQKAKIQLDQRRETIDRANKLLYEESDRMKSFHSKMMLCDVIAEREAQMSLRGELKKLEQIREDRFLEMEKQMLG
eukprot:g29760.t1